jgi:protein SCO1/2
MKSCAIVCIAFFGTLGLLEQTVLAQESKAYPHHDMPAMDQVPGDSLYQLSVTLLTAENNTLKLADLRGQPLLVTMFYSHCSSVCPLLTAQLQRMVNQLSPTDRQQIRILMVSFDAARDTPAALTAFKNEHHIQDAHWIIARASASDVRELAAALGIRYRELPDHTFNHSAIISITDLDGTVRASTTEITATDEAFVRAVRAQIAGASRQP